MKERVKVLHVNVIYHVLTVEDVNTSDCDLGR